MPVSNPTVQALYEILRGTDATRQDVHLLARTLPRAELGLCPGCWASFSNGGSKWKCAGGDCVLAKHWHSRKYHPPRPIAQEYVKGAHTHAR
jgi:hypothetical protein